MELLGLVLGEATALNAGAGYEFAVQELLQLSDEPLERSVIKVRAKLHRIELDLLQEGVLVWVKGAAYCRRAGIGRHEAVVLAKLMEFRDPYDSLLAVRYHELGYRYWDAESEGFWAEGQARLAKWLQEVAPPTPPVDTSSLLAQVMMGLESAALDAEVPELEARKKTVKSRLDEGWGRNFNTSLMSSVLGEAAAEWVNASPSPSNLTEPPPEEERLLRGREADEAPREDDFM